MRNDYYMFDNNYEITEPSWSEANRHIEALKNEALALRVYAELHNGNPRLDFCTDEIMQSWSYEQAVNLLYMTEFRIKGWTWDPILDWHIEKGHGYDNEPWREFYQKLKKLEELKRPEVGEQKAARISLEIKYNLEVMLGIRRDTIVQEIPSSDWDWMKDWFEDQQKRIQKK